MSTLAHPPQFRLASRDGNHLVLQSDSAAVVHVFVLEDDMVRLAVLPKGMWFHPKTWAIAPGLEDVPTEGRDRVDVSGFSLPEFALSEDSGRLVVETKRIRLSIKLDGFFCGWEFFDGEAWHRGLRDRPTQAYNFVWWDEKVHHYLAYQEGERYWGLGERSGAMNRAGRRFRMNNVDAMGYSARDSDPLYKHIPFYITQTPDCVFGMYYDTLSDCTFDMMCERSNYHGLYRGFVADYGDLDYTVIAGGSVVGVTKRYTWLTGKPAMMPKWALGYSGSTMSYTDAPNAQERMGEFLAKCDEHDMLCDSFHLSSGYSSIGDKRYVFTWNTDKFPDPRAFVRSYEDAGVHLIPNIKPCLLAGHPLFKEAEEKGLFIADKNGGPSWVQFWGAIGAYLDFTNPDAIAWWKEKVKTQLLDYGIGSTWNDNNEFEIVSRGARAHGFGNTIRAIEAKPLHTMQMVRTSQQVQREHAPDKRPFLVSRAGSAGMQRYVQTWSGDNTTGWEALKYNVQMGLGLALSGISNTGHDVGGFAGPKPDAELFVRWVACGIFMPRFSIHSWNSDGTANEPWMHPEVTGAVRELIKFRYRLLPYLYDLTWRYARHFEPIIRPTFAEFPDDPNCLVENDDMMLGPCLLVAPVVEPGQTSREVYLPDGADWFDAWSGERFAGGQRVTRSTPFKRPPLFARAGSVIAVNTAEQHFRERADTRGFWIFPLASGAFETEIFEDDGESEGWREGRYRLWTVRVTSTAETIEVAVSARENGEAASAECEILLPPGERRALTVRIG